MKSSPGGTVMVTGSSGRVGAAVDRAVWLDEDLRPQPRDVYDRTRLAAEHLVGSSAVASTILRIARCFPEPRPVLAGHLLHRAVGLDDVGAATVHAVSQTSVTGTFIIAGGTRSRARTASRCIMMPQP